MRLAVLSDIHGNLAALEAVLTDLDDRSPDLIINLGDCVTGPLWPLETFERLESLALPAVRGNHDRWLGEPTRDGRSAEEQFAFDALTAEQRAALAGLPASLAVAEGILGVHGTPDSDTTYLLEDNVDGRLALSSAPAVRARLGTTTAGLVLCGHSHTAHVARVNAQVIVNPGSVGHPRDAAGQAPDRAEAGSPDARYAIATRRSGRWTIELIALEYGWDVVAAQATANGRRDWAATFR